MLKDAVPARERYVPGLDFAGVVDAQGADVSGAAVVSALVPGVPRQLLGAVRGRVGPVAWGR